MNENTNVPSTQLVLSNLKFLSGMAKYIWVVLLLTATVFSLPAYAVPFNYENTTTGVIDGTTTCAAPIVRTFVISGSDDFTVDNLNVGLTIFHNYRGDIQATLQSPLGTTATIVATDGFNGFFDYDVLLDSASANPLNDGLNDNAVAPFPNGRVLVLNSCTVCGGLISVDLFGSG